MKLGAHKFLQDPGNPEQQLKSLTRGQAERLIVFLQHGKGKQARAASRAQEHRKRQKEKQADRWESLPVGKFTDSP